MAGNGDISGSCVARVHLDTVTIGYFLRGSKMMISVLYGMLGGFIGTLLVLIVVLMVAEGTFDKRTFDDWER